MILSKHTQFKFLPFTHIKTEVLIQLFNYLKKPPDFTTGNTATELYNFCSSCLMRMDVAVLIGVLKGCDPSTVLCNKNTE